MFKKSVLFDFNPSLGRRGLLNLGQTCFLNAVLQCLVHNPLLRNYFLSDKHNFRSCKAENCCCCEMDKLFTEVMCHPQSECYNSLKKNLGRYIPTIRHHMVLSHCWRRLGKRHPNSQGTPSKTRMNSSWALSTKSTWPHGALPMSRAIASSTRPSLGSCRAM